MEQNTLSGLSILVVEDEMLLRKQATAFLERMGAEVCAADSLAKARTFISELSLDFVLLDVNLPDGLGTDLLKEKVFSPNTGVIVMTAQGGVNGAVQAMRIGALDYLSKPFDLAELPVLFARARRSRQTRRIEEQSQKNSETNFVFGPSLVQLESQLKKIIGADFRAQSILAPVLIQGETGTGKTTIARWIHHHGPRSNAPLVEVNCSALPETLAESELFGHEKGAFTDARNGRIGLFEAADGGSLFLDELPSLSLPIQAKLLKVIEDQRLRRVGGNKEIPIDVRIIAATNKDLKKLASEGAFREDLYHRLDLFRVNIPALRERGEDMLRLAGFFLERLCEKHRVPRKAISEGGRKRLLGYPWPGNVRELAHEVERAIIFEEGPALEFGNLTGSVAGLAPSSERALPSAEWFNEAFVFPPEGFSLEEAINRMINHALRQKDNNVSGAARLLGVSRDYVRYRLANKPGENGEASATAAGAMSPEER